MIERAESLSEKFRPWRGPRTLAILLLASALCLGYGYYLTHSLPERGLFEYWANDFRAFFATGRLIAESEGERVYTLSAQTSMQESLYRSYLGPAPQTEFAPIPFPYLPVFAIVFVPFALWPPTTGLSLWLLLNLLVFVYVLRRDWGNPNGMDPARSLRMIAASIALPVFLNFAFAQVNVLLLVGVMGSVRAWSKHDEAAVGRWLSLLIIKPQSLPLLLIGFLLRKKWTALSWFAISAFLLATVGFLFVGLGAVSDYANLLLRYPSGLATTYPESMMNFRALALATQDFLGRTGTGLLLVIASAGTLGAVSLLWWRWDCRQTQDLPTLYAASLAAGSLISWHSHVHMALPLVVLLWIPGRVSTELEITRYFASFVVALGFLFGLVARDVGTAHQIAGLLMVLANLGVLYSAHAELNLPSERSPGTDR